MTKQFRDLKVGEKIDISVLWADKSETFRVAEKVSQDQVKLLDGAEKGCYVLVSGRDSYEIVT